MHPEPVGRVAADGDLKCLVYVAHDGGGGTRPAILVGGDVGACFNPPAGQTNPVADAGDQSAMIAQREDRRGCRRGALVPQERSPQRAARLVRQQAQHNTRLVHESLQCRRLETALEEEAARTLAQRLHQAVDGWLTQTTVSRGALVGGRKLTEAGIQLEVPELANGSDHALRRLPRKRRY